MTTTTEEAERFARWCDTDGFTERAAALRSLAAERDALKGENARLRPESRKLRRLVRDLLENDPDDMAADAVTVLDVWRKEARAALGEKE
jgi:hypothetical protein